MNKIEMLKQTIQSESAKREQMKNDLPSLRANAEKVKAQADAAAEAGNIDEYLSLHREQEKLEATLYVTEKVGNIPYTVKREEVKAAWDEYAKGHNRKMKEAIAKYTAATEALRSAFKECLTLQDDALKVRQDLGDMMGERPVNSYDSRLENIFPMLMMGRLSVPQCDYLARLIAGDDDVGVMKSEVWRVMNDRNA